MSVWTHPAISASVKKLEDSGCFASDNPAVIWSGIRKAHMQAIREQEAQSKLLFHSRDAAQNEREIDTLHKLEIVSQFWGSVHNLTSPNPEIKKRAEERVQRVINGRMAVFEGFTLSTQLRRHARSAAPCNNRARVHVDYDPDIG